MNNTIPKGYKQSEAGIIPEDWEVVKLGDIASFFSGGTPLCSNRIYYSGNIPFIGSGDINKKFVEKYITNDALKNSSAKLVEKGDLLYALYGATSGEIAIAKISGAINQAVLCIRSNENITFLYSYLLSNKEKIISTFLQGGQGNLSAKIIQNLKILLPPKKEQQKIAKFLTTWDKAIDTQQKLITTQQQLKKGLMQQLLTGKTRFPEFSSKWQEVKLGDIADIVMGQSPSSNSYNENNIGIPLIQGNADCKDRLTIPRMYTTEKTKICSIGDIIMTVRAPVGAISKSMHNACIGRGVCAITANYKNKFLYHYLIYYENKWETYSQGTTFTAVNSDDIKNLKIKFPSEKEQNKIAKVLSLADDEINQRQKELEQLKQQKKALMQKLLTGKIRIKI